LGPDEEQLRNDSNELARRLAKHYRGHWYHLLAPAIVANETLKRAVESSDTVSSILLDGQTADIYLVSVGGADPTLSTKVKSGLITASALSMMVEKHNVVGTICANMFDANGKPHLYPKGVLIGISLDDLQSRVESANYVLAVAGDLHKHKAIYGALKGGFINCLVTDQRCARWLLEKD